MQADELAFLEEMIESAELLDCTTCGEDTLHVHEEVNSIAGGVTGGDNAMCQLPKH